MDEPLSEWVQRRDARIGRLRAVPLVSGDTPRAAHLNPDEPRAIQRWNGHTWEPYAVVPSLAAAQRLLYPAAEPPPDPSDAFPAPTGRHRKPRTAPPEG
ncbi:DUF6087 family protein [Streptomyces sp. NRRL F-5123]|uniref:DUF6087 family protein n=1 Tax=Streptomyces sp. NRRL F-5123 TaxID=1463856 RepID=UPI0004E1D6CA|nr:DUF6087 family protein [Streptomyces sp. NRRL F-5123]